MKKNNLTIEQKNVFFANKHNKKVQKTVKIFNQLTKKQQNKLYKDYDLFVDNTLNIKLNKINSILETGYYPYYSTKYKWLKKQQNKIVNKIGITDFIEKNGYKYLNL